MPNGTDATELPIPSRAHATCAWCGDEYVSIVDLIDHVDVIHMPQRILG